MKRFYEAVMISPDGPPWQILLDGKPIRTPVRRRLRMPTRALAEAIGAEWAEQGPELHVPSMRLTKLATASVDLRPDGRRPAERQVLDYLGTDMLCYRASHPGGLVSRQQAVWQPWLDWLERAFDVRLPVVQGVLPQEIDPEALARLRPVVEGLDDWRLVAAHAAVTGTGSLVLGLAMTDAVLRPDEAFAAAALDDLYSVEHWGDDPQITQRHATLMADLEAIGQFVTALAPQVAM